MKNLVITAYRCGQLYTILARTLDEVQVALDKWHVKVDATPIIESLKDQLTDPNKFPNVLLFLDSENSSLSVDEYIKDNALVVRKR